MVSVVTAGELLVEIMRPEADVPFSEASEFVGPFPSGAPAIFVDAVALLDRSAGIVGGVGEDGFGRCLLDRLERDGVNTSQVRTVERSSTGVAFVTYSSDGSRQFIFHVDDAAAGAVGPADVAEPWVADADAVHVNGSSLATSESMREACYRTIEVAAEHDLLVSLDPNLRTELLGVEQSKEVIAPVLDHADVVVPTGEELAVLTDSDGTAAGARQLIEAGAGLVAVTRGEDGCELYGERGSVCVPGFDVAETDPTGAGDAFSAATVVGLLEDMSLPGLGTFANAAGAQAVTELGPMEGLAGRETIEEMVARRRDESPEW